MLLDRYLLRRILRPFVAVLVCTVAILLLENLARLMELLQHVRDPLTLLAKSSFYLLPEYLGIGLLVALFLSIALAIRALSLHGEWQIFAAAGITPVRLCLIPFLLGIGCATIELGIHFQFRPAAEHRLDSLFSDVRRGLYGFGGNFGEIIQLDDTTVMTADGFERSTGRLAHIFIAQRGTVYTARSAFVSLDDSGNIYLLLEQGQSIVPRPGDHFDAISFGRLRIRLARAEPDPGHRPGTAFDRLAYRELMRHIGLEREADMGTRKALASFASRCAYAAIALLLPFLALALGALPVRGRSPYGISAGILAIVGYIRLVAYVETAAATHPIAGFGLLVGGYGSAIAMIWRAECRHGPGSVETWLARHLANPIAARIARFQTHFRTG
ncbi:hypothetical protein CA262_20205 [Sphingobium sp. GW456-12-10-14-TSB1]|uniref:LptF/LptG family permease n=1 Tax=Sphingobium TaxID=165695 RepID=UPI000A3CE72C|nr:hypothetical protein CA262_20205 [Sphingobium sp. GW456-12-10-14-TSB1]